MTTKDRAKQVGIMKAKPITERLAAALGKDCFAQPKLRGQRCRVNWVGDKPLLTSSYGNPFYYLGHIEDELKEHFFRIPLDGELYYHDPEFTQQHINSILNRTKNPHPDAQRISLHVFDLVANDFQWSRLTQLDTIFSDKSVSHVVKVPYQLIKTSEWPTHTADYLSQGYEGIILRSLSGHYVPLNPLEDAKRPSCLLKFKPSEKDEYLIIDMIEGKGWATGMLGSFVVVSPEGGASFSVGTGRELTKAKRQSWWNQRNELIGKAMLVVKHEPITTDNGIPICTVAYEVKKVR
jgi:ATP-dependent DNA ligase